VLAVPGEVAAAGDPSVAEWWVWVWSWVDCSYAMVTNRAESGCNALAGARTAGFPSNLGFRAVGPANFV